MSSKFLFAMVFVIGGNIIFLLGIQTWQIIDSEFLKNYLAPQNAESLNLLGSGLLSILIGLALSLYKKKLV